MEHKLKNPFDEAILLSRLLFWWAFKYLRYTSKNSEIPETPVALDDSIKILGPTMQISWDKQTASSSKSPNLYIPLFEVFGKKFILYALCDLLNECVLRVVQPFLLQLLIQSISNMEPWENLFMYAALLCSSTFVYSLVIHNAAFRQFRLGLQCRVALSYLVYNKILKLYYGTEINPGQIVNLLSTDVARFENSILMHYIIIGPLQIIIFTILLWREFGISALGIVGVIVLTLPVQYIIFLYSTKFREELSSKTDLRNDAINEMISNINVVKTNGWEDVFYSKCMELRKIETRFLVKRANVQALNLSLYNASVKIITLAGILCLFSSNVEIDAGKIFLAVSAATTMLYSNLYCIPTAALQLASIRVSVRRMEEYLSLPDCVQSKLELVPTSQSIICQNVTAFWKNKETPILQNVSFDISGPKLVMITGPVASGKSSLLNLLINELIPSVGEMKIRGNVSFSSQEAWCYGGTILDNILLAEKFDKNRFDRILEICALSQDLKSMKEGVFTPVGESGENLSGGQRTRINLARCVYKEADIYLLDDPFSALDPFVCRQIFNDCVKTLLKDKIVIIATSTETFSEEADEVWHLEEGKFMKKYAKLKEERKFDLHIANFEKDNEGTTKKPAKIDPVVESRQSSSLKTVIKYIINGGNIFLFLLIMIGIVSAQAITTYSDFLLTAWVNSNEENGNSYYNELSNLHLYATSIIIATTGTILSGLGFFHYCINVSTSLHNTLLKSVTYTSMNFFLENETGKIMNRFSKDMWGIDEIIPESMFTTIQMFMQLLGVIAVVTVSNKIILVPTIIVLIIFFFIRKQYIKCSRELKHMEASSNVKCEALRL